MNFGLEGFYNEQLKGRPGIVKEEKDALVDEIMSKIHGDTSSLKELVMQFRRERDKYLL